MKKLLLFFAAIFMVACNSEGSDEGFATVKISTITVNTTTFTFKAVITGDYESLEWEFSDGTTVATETSVTKVFEDAGSYTVILTVGNGSGATVSATETVTVAEQPAEKVYTLVWSDEFDGDALNTTDNWTYETGYIANNELQNYQRSSNLSVSDGVMTITAEKVNDDKVYGSYTSSRINTYGKQSFTYGRIEARMRLPLGTGVWPAFWMLGNTINTGDGWPLCGEIDIMEYVGYDPHTIHANLHTYDYNGGNGKGGSITVEDESDWHVYGMTWTAEGIEFYLDDAENVYYSYRTTTTEFTSWPFVQPFFIVLNLAIGGDWGGVMGVDNTIFPVQMDVDYVRVYQLQ